MMQGYANALVITENPGNWFLNQLRVKVVHDVETKTNKQTKEYNIFCIVYGIE